MLILFYRLDLHLFTQKHLPYLVMLQIPSIQQMDSSPSISTSISFESLSKISRLIKYMIPMSPDSLTLEQSREPQPWWNLIFGYSCVAIICWLTYDEFAKLKRRKNVKLAYHKQFDFFFLEGRINFVAGGKEKRRVAYLNFGICNGTPAHTSVSRTLDVFV